jgi:hypothetical protein
LSQRRECAQAKAAYLVTGNLKDFLLPWLDTHVVTARKFPNIMADGTRQ